MHPGYEKLWEWFGLSYASFIVLPRVVAHSMPDDWQARMAKLLEEYEDAFPGVHGADMPSPKVMASKGNKFCKWPDWLIDYRYPDTDAIDALRGSPRDTTQP